MDRKIDRYLKATGSNNSYLKATASNNRYPNTFICLKRSKIGKPSRQLLNTVHVRRHNVFLNGSFPASFYSLFIFIYSIQIQYRW